MIKNILGRNLALIVGITIVGLSGAIPAYASTDGQAISCEMGDVVNVIPNPDTVAANASNCNYANQLNTDPTKDGKYASETGVGNTVGATTITGGTNGVGTDAPAVVIQGQNGSGALNTATGIYPKIPVGTGVLITGAGYDGGPDVYIASQNGQSAISVTNDGVQIISPAGKDGSPINVNSTNNFGNAGVYNTGSVTNNFGNGNSTSSGPITNTIGNAALDGGTVTNTIGGGSGVSSNTIGNTNGDTTVEMLAGGTTMKMANGVATTSLQSGGGIGNSVLPGGGTTSANSGAVLAGATGAFVTVDRNGKLTVVENGVADQSSSNMTVTNGAGNTHGFFVNERQATMSGGVNSSSMTLNDYGATFSNSDTGGPIRVHGVYDGVSQFDAVNVRQLYGAVAASMATVPNFTLEPGESGIGFGTAMMGSYPALGMAFAQRNKNGSQINFGIAAAEHVPIAVRAGVGWVW